MIIINVYIITDSLDKMILILKENIKNKKLIIYDNGHFHKDNIKYLIIIRFYH